MLNKKLATLLLPLLCACASASAQTIYGITLNQPLTFPPCAPGEAAAPTRVCYVDPHQQTIQPPGIVIDKIILHYPRDQKPETSTQNTLTLSMREGKVASIMVSTAGLQDQQAVYEHLTRRFGTTTNVLTIGSQPIDKLDWLSPGSLFAIWELTGLTIGFAGQDARLQHGFIRFESTPLLPRPNGRP